MKPRQIVGAGLALVSWATAPLHAQSFAASRYIPIDNASLFGDMVVGDWNGDGRPDLAVFVSKGVQIFLADKAQGFAAPRTYGAGEPGSLAVGDLDGDGRADLVALSSSSPMVVFLGDGAGGFRARTTAVQSEGCFAAVAIADMTGDGHADLVASCFSGVNIFPGDGRGSFGAPTKIGIGLLTDDVRVGDFNGDGRLDIVAGAMGVNGVLVFLGTGGGRFQGPVHYATGGNDSLIAVGDYNGDHVLDIAAAGFLNGEVTVLLGDGSGRFTRGATVPAGPSPAGVLAADFDGDGKLDLAVFNAGASGTVSILLGDGGGGFAAPIPFAVPEAGIGPTETMRAADLDGDGRADLAILDKYLPNITVLSGAPRGLAAPAAHDVGASPSALATGDFNGDGFLDVVSANEQSGDVSILLGDGAGGLGQQARVAVGTDPRATAIGDFNGDSKLDLAVVVGSPPGVSILLGDGAGGFGATSTVSLGDDPVRAAVGDFNGDGKADLAILNGGPCCSGAGYVSILLGDGSGGFSSPTAWSVGSPNGMAVGDLNGDNKLDIVVTSYLPANISVLIGDGSGGFAPAVGYASLGAAAVAVADFDGDGHADVAVGNYAFPGSLVSLFKGDGSGGLTLAKTVPVPGQMIDLLAADVDGDGLPDVVVQTYVDFSTVAPFWVLRADGRGGLGPPTGFTAFVDVGGPARGRFALADFDKDGRVDVAVTSAFTNAASGQVFVALNTSRPPADLAVTVDDGVAAVVPGDTTTYTVRMTNNGPADVAGATIVDAVPPSLEGASWTCSASGGATCSASGSGDIGDVVDLPQGSAATYTLTGRVRPGAIGCTLPNTARVDLPRTYADYDASNDVATDTDALTTALWASNARVREHDGQVAFRVSRTGCVAGVTSVDYATADGTATAGSDYVATSGALSFDKGQSRKTVRVPILDDAIHEGSEAFFLDLMSASGAVVANGRGRCVIVDDDR